uniref:hypothetical protein n=1 Tax=Acetatifactor sp. TaxID=1872090 RepID=UPI004055B980
MRKHSLFKKIVSGMMVLALAFMPTMNAWAASEYTVTFRPGKVGMFGIASESGSTDKNVREMAQEVADIYYAQYETTVTDNGAIKVTVPAGAQMPAAPGYIIPNEGYCVRTWGPEAGSEVTKNVDYVVDYGRLTDGVEYTVKYVDEESGESIAPFFTAYGNIGDVVSVDAPATIMTSDAGVYVLTSDATQEFTLGTDVEINVITFQYEYSYNPGTIEEDVVVSIPGDTVINTQTVTTYIDNGTTAEPGAVVIQGEDQEAEANDEADDEADAEVVDENQNEDQQGEQEIVEIEDEDTPLTNLPESDETVDSEETADMVVEIEEEEAPLYDGLKVESGMNPMVIVAAVFGIAAVALSVVWMQSKKKKNNTDEQ